MPSVDEINAGFDAIIPTLHEMNKAFTPDMFGAPGKIDRALDGDTAVRAYIVQGVKEVLLAGEHVREGKTLPAPKAIPQLVATLKAYIEGTDIPDRPDVPGQNCRSTINAPYLLLGDHRRLSPTHRRH